MNHPARALTRRRKLRWVGVRKKGATLKTVDQLFYRGRWSVVFFLSPMPFGVLSPAIALPLPRGPRPSRPLRGDFEPSVTGRKSSATKGRHAPRRAISARLGFSLFFVGHDVTSAGSWATFNRVTPGWTRELQPFLVGHGVTNALRFSLGR